MDVVSLTAIETAMLAVLSAAVLRDGENSIVQTFDIRRGFDDAKTLPAVCIALEDIRYEILPDGACKWSPGFAMYEVFKNPVNEAARRKGVYPMIEGAVRLLAGSKLSLDIEALRPEVTSEIVHASLDARSAIAFKTVFRTSFDVDRPEDTEDLVYLVTSAIDYYRSDVDPESATPDVADVVTPLYEVPT